MTNQNPKKNIYTKRPQTMELPLTEAQNGEDIITGDTLLFAGTVWRVTEIMEAEGILKARRLPQDVAVLDLDGFTKLIPWVIQDQGHHISVLLRPYIITPLFMKEAHPMEGPTNYRKLEFEFSGIFNDEDQPVFTYIEGL